MYHLGIARTGVCADRVLGFQYDYLATGKRQLAGNGKADDTGADDGAVDFLGHDKLSECDFSCVILLPPILTDDADVTPSHGQWNPDWPAVSELFVPLRPVARFLSKDAWPDVNDLNALGRQCSRWPVNSSGTPIRFVAQRGKPARFEDTFEPRTYLKGEVLVREANWHDLFNALVWTAFPASKAAINARHYASLTAQRGSQRSRQGDALTTFDEDGVVVLSSNAELLELLRRFRWQELFLERREAVRSEMRFIVFGHALYEKALKPFVGMTAKSVLLKVPSAVVGLQATQLTAEADRLLSAYVGEPANLRHGKSLSPLPVLGIPGWWPANESAAFYEDTSYFRSGRRGGKACWPSSIS